MTRNSPAGAGVADAGLPPDLIPRLKDLGIVTCAQLHDLLSRRWREEHARVLLGMGLDEAQRRFGARLQEAVGASMGVLSASRFQVPSLTGICGPVSGSPLLSTRRARSEPERRAVARWLRETGESLPKKVLLTKFLSPVGDQGRLGSCTGWGSTANREMLAGKHLSPLFAYKLAKYLDGRPDVEGSWQHFCFEGFVRFGHVREGDCPYTDRPASLAIDPHLRKASEFRARGFSDVRLHSQDMDVQPLLMKRILAGRLGPDLGPQPVSVSIAIHETWKSASTSLYGLVTVPVDGERRLGGHAMLVAGYVDADAPDNLYGTDYFVVKNSWGSRWAAQNPLALPGYALIPASYFTRKHLLWEALVCLAERSPGANSILDWLRVGWDTSHVASTDLVA